MNYFVEHAYDIGCGIAALIWPLMKKRQKIAIENILRAKITDDPEEAKRIAKKSFCHFAGHIGEALFVPGIVNKDNYREHFDFSEASPVAAKLLLDTPDEPILIVSGHHGVWEAATNTISFARPMIAIARTMNNPLAQKFLKKFHFRGPVTIIDKNNGFTKPIMEQWKRDNAAMTILIDQHYSKGSLLKFMGRPAMCHTSAARLAIRTGRKIVVGSFVRLAPYKYGLVGDDPLQFDKDTDRDAAAQMLNDRLEKAIRAYPEQYLWAHRRWRND